MLLTSRYMPHVIVDRGMKLGRMSLFTLHNLNYHLVMALLSKRLCKLSSATHKPILYVYVNFSDILQ